MMKLPILVPLDDSERNLIRDVLETRAQVAFPAQRSQGDPYPAMRQMNHAVELFAKLGRMEVEELTASAPQPVTPEIIP